MSVPTRPTRATRGGEERPSPLQRRFTSRLHEPRTAALLGTWLAVAFGTCFLTGLASHLVQHPTWWSTWPTRPVSLYAVTQGVHVATGLASIPLLLAKLWTVYPRLFAWPPVHGVAHALERGSLLVLVGGSLLQLFTGLANIGLWYPWPFFFTTTHFWTAWLVIGALCVHIATKLVLAREHLGSRRPREEGTDPDRRRFLTGVALAAGAVTVATVGQTLHLLRPVSLLAPRVATVGPQGLPVNKSAVSAGVEQTAADPGYELVVDGPAPLTLSLVDLQALEQHTEDLPVACVEGWNALGTWTGVRVRDLLERAGWDGASDVRVESLQTGSRYSTSLLPAGHARDPRTLLALQLGGEELALDHGYPCRLIAPTLPGVMQTKWVARLGPVGPAARGGTA